MLKNTFLHIPGVTEKKEKELWEKSVYDWDSFLENSDKLDIRSKARVKKLVHASRCECEKKNHLFFEPILPRRLHWRAYPEFSDRCCFLDIETTGLSKHRNDVTTIGVYDGKSSRVFVNGIDLHEFSDEIKKYSMLVTFNGICFDIPFLRTKFPDIEFNQLHVDLRYALKALGYSGGLKSIEKQLGIARDDEVADMDGFQAVRLWHKYKRGDQASLDKLIKYNIEDIVNLKTLMEFSYDNLKKQCFECRI
ncbi:MAG: ribonuclease H-like domain-containing protein [Nanoarchaeota archaeon]|nr:ribonuclease H-like domain-containing protein [Nanoarchaeota archaeon]